MAALDLNGIENEMGEIFRADASLDGVKVLVEEEPVSLEDCPCLEIRLVRISAPADIQRLSAGQLTRFRLEFSVRAWAYSMESQKDARQKRNDLLGKAQIVLMGNRTINDKVFPLYLEGGDLWISSAETSFGSVGETIAICEADART